MTPLSFQCKLHGENDTETIRPHSQWRSHTFTILLSSLAVHQSRSYGADFFTQTVLHDSVFRSNEANLRAGGSSTAGFCRTPQARQSFAYNSFASTHAGDDGGPPSVTTSTTKATTTTTAITRLQARFVFRIFVIIHHIIAYHLCQSVPCAQSPFWPLLCSRILPV